MIRSNKKKIGIFGGSFDPPHKGHLKISKIAIKKLSLDKIFGEMDDVPLKDDVWPLFLGENAKRVLKLGI